MAVVRMGGSGIGVTVPRSGARVAWEWLGGGLGVGLGVGLGDLCGLRRPQKGYRPVGGRTCSRRNGLTLGPRNEENT